MCPQGEGAVCLETKTNTLQNYCGWVLQLLLEDQEIENLAILCFADISNVLK